MVRNITFEQITPVGNAENNNEDFATNCNAIVKTNCAYYRLFCGITLPPSINATNNDHYRAVPLYVNGCIVIVSAYAPYILEMPWLPPGGVYNSDISLSNYFNPLDAAAGFGFLNSPDLTWRDQFITTAFIIRGYYG